MNKGKKKKSKISTFLKIVGSSSLLTTVCVVAVLICILMLLDFFGVNLTKEKVQNNVEYAEEYKTVLNKYLKDGYVPLQRLLYFHLEDLTLTLETLYTINQNTQAKTTRDILVVCSDERVKNMVACTEENINENKEYLTVTTAHFNFPLNISTYNVSSFYNEQRVVYGEENLHSGWDFVASAQTPVYSVCNGTVTKVNYTQTQNIPYDQSSNSIGNTITIKCDKDYNDTYFVTYAHLYPNSAKVKVGDVVSHWTEVASVGTTGHSTGNHLHYQVENSNGQLLDGMQFINMNLKKSS